MQSSQRSDREQFFFFTRGERTDRVHHCPHFTFGAFPLPSSFSYQFVFFINYIYLLFTSLSLQQCTMWRFPGLSEDSQVRQGDVQKEMFLGASGSSEVDWATTGCVSCGRFQRRLHISAAERRRRRRWQVEQSRRHAWDVWSLGKKKCVYKCRIAFTTAE